jgi:O-antigen/teichoic acid export membrane protein
VNAEAGEGQRPLRDLVKHTLVYGSGYVTMAAVSLVLTPVYTHYLNPSQFGLLALMLVLYGLMTQVYDLGFTNSVGRFFFDSTDEGGEGGLGEMRTTSVLFMVVYGGFLTAALWLLAPEVSDLLTQTDRYAELVRIVSITLYAEALAIPPLTLIRMQERSRLYVGITVVRFAATLGLNLLFVVVLHEGVRGILLGSAISAGGVLLFLAPEYLHAARRRPSRQILRQMLAFGLPFFPVLVSAWLIDASDRYLLELFRTRTEVGEYALAYRIGQVMQIAVAAFSMGWAPLRYRIYERSDAKDVYRRLTTYYVIAVTILGVGVGAFAPEIVAAIAPASYEDAAPVVPLILLAYAIYGLFLMMVTGMGITKQTVPMAWIGAAGAIANVGINLLVIPRWGMEGAATTTILAYAIMVAGAWFYSQRVYPIPYEWGRMFVVASIAIVAVGVAILVSPSNWALDSLLALVGWLCFLAALVATKAVRPAELTSALGGLRRLRSSVLGRPRPGER